MAWPSVKISPAPCAQQLLTGAWHAARPPTPRADASSARGEKSAFVNPIHLETAIKPPNKRLRSYETYKSVITRHLWQALGAIRLQQLQPTDVQRYYTVSTLAPATLVQHHMILHSALKAAQMQGLVSRNVAKLVINKPRREEGQNDAREHCWPAEDAQQFLAITHTAGSQMAAFYHLALDTGARKGEVCGLRWQDVDLQAGQVVIMQQLVKSGAQPQFGPPKNGISRSITLMPYTVELLRQHRARQAEIKLANRHAYHDFGLVFAKDWHGMKRQRDGLGHPLSITVIGQGEFKRLSAEAGVKSIKFHGLRHTCATLLLQAGVPVHVVSKRLGHKKVEVTLNIYAHVLPAMQEDAAAKLANLLQR